MTQCASGCTRLGKHLSTCACASCTARGRHKHCDECRGCEPREAIHGTLCGRCWTALTRDLATAPALVDWLRQHVELGSGSDEGKTSGTRDPAAPLSVQAVAAADDYHAMLCEWARLVVERHPDRLTPPSLRGSIVKPASKRKVDGHVVYEPATVVGLQQIPTQTRWLLADQVDVLGYPAHLRYAEPRRYRVPQPAPDRPTENVCRWLLTHLEWVAAQDFAAEMVREVTGTTATLLARWPQEARARRITDMECPECGRVSLVYYPVPYLRGSVLVQCEHHDCGHRIDEDKWAWTAKVLADTKRSTR